MADERIYSAQTKKLEEMKSTWVEIFKDVEGRWELEDFKKNSITNKILAKFQRIPPAQYMVNFLFTALDMDATQKEIENTLKYIRDLQKAQKAYTNKKYARAEKLLMAMTAKMSSIFLQNGVTKKKSEPVYIRDLLLNLDKTNFFEIALGLQMELQDVELFLRKALNQAGFNYYNKKEMLLWIVFRYGNYHYKKQYEALNKYYNNLPSVKKDDHEILSSDTQYIRDRLEKKAVDKIFEDSHFCQVHPEIDEFLRWHKKILPEERTAVKIFNQLWKEALIANRESIAAFYYLKRTDKNGLEEDCIYGDDREKRSMTVEVAPVDDKKPLEKGAVMEPERGDPMIGSAVYDGKGNLTVKCETGTYIRRGTIFICNQEGRKHRYAVTKDKIAIKYSLFQEYLYGMELCESDKKINRKLLGDWFQMSKIDDNTRSFFDKRSDERKRAVILTLLFLKFVGEWENIEAYDRDTLYMFREFEEEVDEILGQCGMQKFYMGNPYDALLAFLLVTTDTPIDTLRFLWAVVGGKNMKYLKRVPLKEGAVLEAGFCDIKGNHYINEIEVNRLIGEGSTSLVYEAEVRTGKERHVRMILKEFYPRSEYDAFSIERDGVCLKVAGFTKRNEAYRRCLTQFKKGYDLQRMLSNSEAMEIVIKPAAFFQYGDSCYILSSMHMGRAVEFRRFERLGDMLLFFVRLTEALEILHEQGRVFLDMKPENILWIDRAKMVKFFDVDSMADLRDIDNVHREDINYNQRYTSPQIKRLIQCDEVEFESKKYNYLGIEADVYSTGVLMLEALLGKLPEDEGMDNKDSLRRELKERYGRETMEDDSIIEQLLNIMYKATANKRRNRYRNARELCDDLTVLLNKLHARKFIPRKQIAEANYMIAMYDLMGRHPLFEYIKGSGSEAVVDAAFAGRHPMRKFFLKAAFSCGQMRGVRLRIHLFSKDSADFVKGLSEECPALEKVAVISENGKVISDKIDPNMAAEPMAYICSYSGGLRQIAEAIQTFGIHYMICDETEEKDVRAVVKEFMGCSAEEKPFLLGTLAEGGDLLETGIEKAAADNGKRINGLLQVPIPTKKRTPFYDENAAQSRLERRAYRIHRSYMMEKFPEAGEERIQDSYFSSLYNMESSMRSAAAVSYKCAAADLSVYDENLCERYRETVLSDTRTARKAMAELTAMEHRSWMAFMILNGWDAPPDRKCIEEYAFSGGNDFKDAKRKLHPCLVRSEPRYEAADSDSGQGTADPLGEMNQILHDIAEKKSQKAHEVIRDAFDDMERFSGCEKGSEKGRLIEKLREAYKDVRMGKNEAAARWEAAYEEARENLSQEPYANDEMLLHLTRIGDRIRIILEYNANIDYRKLDEAIVRSVPYVLEEEGVE